MKNIQILHISEFGGHSKAAQNLKEALLYKNPQLTVRSLNGLGYFYPRGEKMIDFIYTSTIKHFPHLWGKAYDRKKVQDALAPYHKLVNKCTFKKLNELIAEHNPDCFVATQAFPCGAIADFKAARNIKIPLVAVVTDYHPHRYWVHPQVDRYIVACEEAKEALTAQGVGAEKVKILGIPISVQFLTSYPKEEVSKELGFSNGLPSVLVMGGGLGLGPFKVIAQELEDIKEKFQIIVVCGRNKSLYKWFLKNKSKFNKPIFAFGYTNHIHKIMDFVDIIITKGGGITISEALAKGLCIVVSNPIPGQEELNVNYLLKEKAIIKADHVSHISDIVNELLRDQKKLYSLRERAKEISFIDSSLRIVDAIFELIS
ncbi:MAG: glycosyltransferase [Candidatus Omnitrophica bacterium]|nr:glycosyltransferase [Candidatus Omnitrophota bacterium]